MSLSPGARLGPYELIAPLGAGGMGEVYRARDPRLARDIAIKVLPADLSEDPVRLRRFEQESKATGALNHPNLLAVYDTGLHDGVPYIVFELIQGETLRARLASGSLPARKAVHYAAQIAHGLAAAHEQGIVHRDLKPENLLVTEDGRVKILDFGLAKLNPIRDREGVRSDVDTASQITDAGAVLGTAGYMSPEQVQGLSVDHRSDVFSFGAVFYEMLSGRRAFQGNSAVETMNAILNDDPEELAPANGNVPPAVERIVRRCLEKRPQERFQSARDIAFALEALSASPGLGPRPLAAPARSRRRVALRLVAAAGIAGAVVGAFLLGHESTNRPGPSFRRLTFRRGATWGAKFTPDGQTIVYGASWEGQPIRLFSTRVDSPESRPMDLPDADILAISRTGEMAILLNRPHMHMKGPPETSLGTLARLPLAGGAPREILDNVQGADWSPDGQELAVVHRVGERKRLEFPIGTVLYEADVASELSEPRVSANGDLVAFIDGRDVAVVDRHGHKRILAAGKPGVTVAFWSPRGDELWFEASEGDLQSSLYAVTLAGRQRLLAHFPAWAKISDAFRDGRLLLTLMDPRSGIIGLAPGDARERDISWLNGSNAAALSADGSMLLFSEVGQRKGQLSAAYLRKTDDSSPPVRLGEGWALALSPDSRWALAARDRGSTGFTSELTLLPTGTGESKVLKGEGILYERTRFLPDAKRIIVEGRETGRERRLYVQELAGGRPRPLTAEGSAFSEWALSPDGRFVALQDPGRKILLYPVDGGEPQPAPGPPEPGDIGPWSADGRFLFATEIQGLAIRVFRREMATGRRELWKEFSPADPAGIFGLLPIIAPDGKSYVYTYWRALSNLYLVDGLK